MRAPSSIATTPTLSPTAAPDVTEVYRHRFARRCYNCDELGHIVRNCPYARQKRQLRSVTTAIRSDLKAKLGASITAATKGTCIRTTGSAGKHAPCSTNRFSVLDSCAESTAHLDTPLPPKSAQNNPEEVAPSTPKPEEKPADFILIRSTRVKRSTELDVRLESVDSHQLFHAKALLDSGAMGLFIDAGFAEFKNLTKHRLPRAILLYNIDGTPNEHGSVKETVDLIVRYQGHTERATFYVTNLGGIELVLGHSWLVLHNPEIDWTTGTVSMSRCPGECRIHKIRAKRRQRRGNQAKRKARDARRQPPQMTSVVEDAEEEELDTDELGDDPDAPEEGDRIFSVILEDNPTFVRATSNVSQRLAEAAEKHRLKKEWKESVPQIYHTFEKVFLKESFDELPQHRKWDHAIELVPEAESFSTKSYRMSLNEESELNHFLDENLKSGRIRPSKSPMASPVFFIKKKDGTLRLVQDYRKLNAITVKNSYPLPLIPDLLDKASKAKIFTKLDVRWGYNNVRIKEGDEWKAAFRTSRGLFEPLVMFFGLTNSPATFQTMMNELFKELVDEGAVVVYIDDILIFTATLEEHRRVVRRVLEVLAENNLFLKPEKCTFEAREVEFLGFIVSEGNIEMDPVKVAGVPSSRMRMRLLSRFSQASFRLDLSVNFFPTYAQTLDHQLYPVYPV